MWYKNIKNKNISIKNNYYFIIIVKYHFLSLNLMHKKVFFCKNIKNRLL